MSSAADSQAFEMSLRDQLIAAQNNHAPPQPQQPHQHAAPTTYAAHPSHPPPPHHQHDPVMAIQPYAMTHDSPDLGHPHSDPAADANAQGPAAGKKGRAQRELSNTKRAAQNRAAQRAFRLRKEQHINKLEEDLKQYLVMEENYKTLEHENLALRNYISLLQSKLSDQNIDFPPAPEQASMRSASISDNQSSHQEQGPIYHPVPNQQPAQHDHHPHHEQHRYPDPSPAQSHGGPSNVYPQSTHDQHHQHQHEPPTNAQPVPQDHANDSLPAAAISQLQAAAAQAGTMDRPRSPPQTQHDQHQQSHPQDPQYVRASEYPAHKRARLDSPSHQPQALSDKPDA
ncbi:hypothetical protein KCU95_g10830, partial [Aureobasidium melanogenum]